MIAVRLATHAMGTRFELVVTAGSGDLRAAGEAALEEIEIWHTRLNRFASDSLVSHLARSAAHLPVRLDRQTFALFDDALKVWRASGGAFDITVAPAMARGGFAESAVLALGTRSGSAAIVLNPAEWTLGFAEAGVGLDLGAIAKGHALDCAADVLRRAGVTSAFLQGGTSSAIAIGRPPGGPGWTVAIRSSRRLPPLQLRDSAMAVSDASGRRSIRGASHLIDPRHGGPVHPPARAVVAGPSARLSDAWATALSVLGHVPPAFPRGYAALAVHDEHQRA